MKRRQFKLVGLLIVAASIIGDPVSVARHFWMGVVWDLLWNFSVIVVSVGLLIYWIPKVRQLLSEKLVDHS
jgi:hypothetical protein